jgi:PLP dependent protein
MEVMNSIKHNIEIIRSRIPEAVRLVVVSKTHPVASIMQAYEAGQRVFGENKVQELMEKQPLLPNDIEWHFIGHLQTNKVKYIAPFVNTIHSIDSLKLVQEIDKQAGKHKRIINGLLEFHIAEEESKFGLDAESAKGLITAMRSQSCKHLSLAGVMGMATYTENEKQIREEFSGLHRIYNELKGTFFSKEPSFKEISMGMTSDYPIAIEEGATIIRIGSAIFGERL